MLRVCNPDLISLGSQNRGYKPLPQENGPRRNELRDYKRVIS